MDTDNSGGESSDNGEEIGVSAASKRYGNYLITEDVLFEILKETLTKIKQNNIYITVKEEITNFLKSATITECKKIYVSLNTCKI